MRGLVPDPAGGGDVIVAPATPPGTSALAVVRLSGPPGETLRVARRLAPGLGEPRSWGAKRARLVDARGDGLDDAVVLFFAAPRSPTGEEVVEILSHGSPAVVAALLAAARAAGARPARPGEFARRALANGKADLSSLEGVGRLVGAESREEARRALALADGALARRVRGVRDGAFALLAGLEAALDFPEDVAMEDGPGGDPAGGGISARTVREAVEALAAEAGALAGQGAPARPALPVVAILGRPNAGKSTLFNALVGEDRAIVSAGPGTTRDLVSEVIETGAGRLRLVDTAGLTEAAPLRDEVEAEGIARARRASHSADLVLYVVERGETTPEDEAELARWADEGERLLLVASKADLVPSPAGRRASRPSLRVCAATGEGMEALRRALDERLLAVETGGEILLLARHAEALRRAADAFGEGARALRDGERSRGRRGGGGDPGEPGGDGADVRDDGSALAASALREGLSALGEITGETAPDDLLDAIFSTFCVGK